LSSGKSIGTTRGHVIAIEQLEIAVKPMRNVISPGRIKTAMQFLSCKPRNEQQGPDVLMGNLYEARLAPYALPRHDASVSHQGSSSWNDIEGTSILRANCYGSVPVPMIDGIIRPAALWFAVAAAARALQHAQEHGAT
jgi:hypothetical protein